MAEPSFMDDLSRTIQERYAMLKQRASEAPDRIAHAVQPVTDRLKLLANDPAEFARTGFAAQKELAQPQIGAAGVAGAAAGGMLPAMDPNARQGVPEEALPGDLANVPAEQRQQSILQAILARAQQRRQ